MTDIESTPLVSTKKRTDVRTKRYKIYLTTITALCIGALLLYIIAERDGKESLVSPVPFEGRLVKGSKAAVAVESEQCSNIGLEILKKGGNAVDSAIASALCIGVINSFATGIGGGGFMLIRSPNGTFEFIDFRETAPNASRFDMFDEDPSLSKVGGLSVGVPGEIRGFELAHKRHGKLSWKELFLPSIDIARNGFEASGLLEYQVKKEQAWILNSTEWSDVYAPNGNLINKGDTVKRVNLAKTLEIIANEGASAFYEGKIAERLVQTIQSSGGIMTLDDFKSYQPVVRETVSTYYNGRKITTCSEPTSGPALLSILNLIERFQFKAEGFTGKSVHRLVEAFKFGFAFRTEFGDPDFIENSDRIKEIITKDYASEIRQKINDDTTHGPLYYNPKYDHLEDHGTMHLSVVDENDGAVALTSTVNLGFGSHIMDEETGVVLNDEMDDFSIPGIPNDFGLYPSKINYAGPNKRPLSSITPTIIEKDAKFEMALGGSGGSRILTSTVNAIVNVLDLGKDVYEAVAAPRIHHQLIPDRAEVEHGYSKYLQRELQGRNHVVLELPQSRSTTAVQVVRRLPDGTVEAASDPRKMGISAAY